MYIIFLFRMKRSIQFSLKMLQIRLWLRGSSSEEECWGCRFFNRWSRFSWNILLLKILVMMLFYFFFTFSFRDKILLCQSIPISIFWWFYWVFILRTLILIVYKIDFWTFINDLILFLLSSFWLFIKFLLQNFKSLVFFGKIFIFLFCIFRLLLLLWSLPFMTYELLLMVDNQKDVVKQIWKSLTKSKFFFI